MMELKKKPTRLIAVLLVGMSLCVSLMQFRSEPITPDIFDAGQYVRGAYNIFHHGVFSEVVQKDIMPPSQVGRVHSMR